VAARRTSPAAHEGVAEDGPVNVNEALDVIEAVTGLPCGDGPSDQLGEAIEVLREHIEASVAMQTLLPREFAGAVERVRASIEGRSR